MSAVTEIPSIATASEASQVDRRTTILRILTIVTILAVAGGLYMALGYARTDVFQGEVQRIFYIHVASFAGAFVAFCAPVLGGIMYLRTRNVKWDTLALAGVEVGTMLALLNLVTGIIWSRPSWNTWWAWDVRPTTALISVLTYCAYLMLRNAIDNPDTRRRFASVYGILAITTVILTFIVIRLTPNTIHPAVIGPSPQNATAQLEFGDTIKATLGMNSAIWSILVPITLIWWRIRLGNLAERVQVLKAQLVEK